MDNSLFVKVEGPASHVDMPNPEVVGGAAVRGEVIGDVAPIEESTGWNRLGKPGGVYKHLVRINKMFYIVHLNMMRKPGRCI